MALEQRPAAGSLGPRLAGRLTAELILRSRQYMNCVNQYEIDLRGNKIAAIENLGATENQFDSIDLSDNAIVKLEGFPRLNRLKQLLLSNNRISRIAKKLEDSIPNLEVLILTNNRLANLQDLAPLGSLTKLNMISLLGNPVTTKANYRLYLISRCKSLKVLDFKKVKQKEREEAEKKFPTDEAAATEATRTFEPEEDLQAAQAQAGTSGAPAQGDAEMTDAAGAKPKQGPTPEQQLAIKAAIANAATLEEIQRLEAALTTGQLPSEFAVDADKGKEGGQGSAEAEANGHAAEAAPQPDSMVVG